MPIVRDEEAAHLLLALSSQPSMMKRGWNGGSTYRHGFFMGCWRFPVRKLSFPQLDDCIGKKLAEDEIKKKKEKS